MRSAECLEGFEQWASPFSVASVASCVVVPTMDFRASVLPCEYHAWGRTRSAPASLRKKKNMSVKRS